MDIYARHCYYSDAVETMTITNPGNIFSRHNVADKNVWMYSGGELQIAYSSSSSCHSVKVIDFYDTIYESGLGDQFYNAGADAVKITIPILKSIVCYFKSNGYADLTLGQYLCKLHGK